MKVTLGRVGGVLVLAFMRACRLLPEPEMRTLTFAAGGDMAGVLGCGYFVMLVVSQWCCGLPHLHGGVVKLLRVTRRDRRRFAS